MSTARDLVKFMDHLRYTLYEDEHTTQLREGSQTPVCLLKHLARANRRSRFLLNHTRLHAIQDVLTTFIEWQNEEGALEGHETPCHLLFHSVQSETVIIDALTAILFKVIVN